MTRRSRRLLVGSLLTLGTVALAAAPAGAHIEPDPSRVEPGTAATVAFSVEHGCDESPTTKLTFKIPKGAKRVQPVAKDGWTSKVTRTTVVFKDPASAALVADDTFSISFTAPSKATILVWKAVQQCGVGTIRWIDTADDAENPPPLVGVGQDAPTHEDGDDDHHG